MNADRFMISGTEVGDSADTCYFAFFKYEITSDSNWYFGNIFMQKYYTIYDASTSNLGYIQLGLGIAAAQKPTPQDPNTKNENTNPSVITRDSSQNKARAQASIQSLISTNKWLLLIVGIISVCCLVCVCVCCYRTI